MSKVLLSCFGLYLVRFIQDGHIRLGLLEV